MAAAAQAPGLKLFRDAGWTNVSYRTFRVWQRHLDVYLRLWKTESWPPFVEGVLNIVAFGLGLGFYVQSVNGESYLQFIAPAMICLSAMFASSFECTFGAYFRMEEQRTFEAIVATPVSVEDVISAELVWGATRALISSVAILVVISAFGLVSSFWALAIPLTVVLEALAFGGIGLLFTSIAPGFGFFNYFITLVLTPLMLFSGIFFPVSRLPWLVQDIIWISPLYHAVNLMRAFAQGRLELGLAADALCLVAIVLVASSVGLTLMRRRLIN